VATARVQLLQVRTKGQSVNEIEGPPTCPPPVTSQLRPTKTRSLFLNDVALVRTNRRPKRSPACPGPASLRGWALLGLRRSKKCRNRVCHQPGGKTLERPVPVTVRSVSIAPPQGPPVDGLGNEHWRESPDAAWGPSGPLAVSAP